MSNTGFEKIVKDSLADMHVELSHVAEILTILNDEKNDLLDRVDAVEKRLDIIEKRLK